MEDSRYQWTPHGGRRRERPQQSRKNQATDFMRSRNMEEDFEDNNNNDNNNDNNNLTPWLMEPGGSMPHSQGLSNNSYPEPNQPNYPH